MTPHSESPAQGWNQARALMGAGHLKEAQALLEQLVEQDASHLEARNALAVIALSGNDLVSARMHLDKALAVAPGHALTLNQLAQLQQVEGDEAGAQGTYRKLLTAEPSLFAARLSYAGLLERTGDLRAAALQYFRCIRDARQSGRWLSPESTPPSIRPQVLHGNGVVRQYRKQLCEEIISGITQTFGRQDLRRVAAYVAIQLGEASYAEPDTRQQPSAFPFPGLPQSPYLDKLKIRGIPELEASTAAIQAELLGVLTERAGHETVFTEPALAQEFLKHDAGAAQWDGYYFYRHGHRKSENCNACPATSAAIERLPLCRVNGHGPEVLFSLLGPGTHLMPHHGVTNVRVVGHLPLIVPPACALRVAGMEHHWKVGEVVVFDDTYAHEAWNRSDQMRVVMIFDLWHPGLAEVEIAAVKELQQVLGRFASEASTLEQA